MTKLEKYRAEMTKAGYTMMPRHFNYEPHLAKAASLIKEYTTVFLLNGDMLGSGVCVQTGGHFGILTANHVAEEVLTHFDFALHIREGKESEWVERSQFRYEPIGVLPTDASKESHKRGPDLGFFLIQDPALLRSLTERKPFYSLDNQRIDYFSSRPLESVAWGIAASPLEDIKPVKFDFEEGGALTRYTNLVAWGVFKSRTARKDFDYIELRMPCDEKPFPKSYNGTSGGGFWGVALEWDGKDENSVSHGPLLLGGIQFHESKAKNGFRILTGHGFDSIYKNVIQAVKHKSSVLVG